MAGVLLIATIVLGLTASEAATMVSLGVFLMVAAFAVSGIRGGFSLQVAVPTHAEGWAHSDVLNRRLVSGLGRNPIATPVGHLLGESMSEMAILSVIAMLQQRSFIPLTKVLSHPQ